MFSRSCVLLTMIPSWPFFSLLMEALGLSIKVLNPDAGDYARTPVSRTWYAVAGKPPCEVLGLLKVNGDAGASQGVCRRT